MRKILWCPIPILFIMLSVVPNLSAKDFLISTDTSNNAYPVVFTDADGNFLVTWCGERENATQRFGRWIDSNGSLSTDEISFPVSDLCRYNFGMTGDGNFVVTWSDQDENIRPIGYKPSDIYARIYLRDGTPLGEEFKVNTSDDYHVSPRIAVSRTGSFVIAWHSRSGRLYVRVYDKDEVPRTDQFQPTTSGASVFDVAVDLNGSFVVTWVGAGYQVYARRFDSSGLAQEDEFQVSSGKDFAKNSEGNPAITIDETGNFNITWIGSSYFGRNPNYTLNTLAVQRYDSNGNPIGSEFKVDERRFKDYSFPPVVRTDQDGNFAVLWTKSTSRPHSIYLKVFDSSEHMIARDSIRLKSYGFGASLAMNSHGDVLLVWMDNFTVHGKIYRNF